MGLGDPLFTGTHMDGSYPKGVTTQIVLKITGIAMRGCNCNWKVNVSRSRFRISTLVVDIAERCWWVTPINTVPWGGGRTRFNKCVTRVFA